MQFKDYLATFPSIDHLSGLDVLNVQGEVVHHIPAVEGKLGSLKLYYALATLFNQQLNAVSAEQGITWFAEHVDDAKQNVGKHPNIDLLLNVIEQKLEFILKPIEK
ncbi:MULTISPECIES: DUF2322 family protein [Glaesserella]|uniref:DUF2322 domain-containing protein n=1 Tax=Glaesserella australis TaxID=2094024 RepID=A0A328C392_9PAST|nr:MULTISPECIES: DUF2322 family protein [Glaesserella]AUI66916.1 hypothetical protein CJD39_10200 [Glaesserella sp. 15-184]RAL19520.1 DUF2322 domain-containing protein [Glaesserella australis]